MTKRFAITALALAGLAIGGAAEAKVQAPAPKVSERQARKIALAAAPGKITDSEYEKEGGGWRWSFDIQQKGHIQEIGVDGQTGKIVENSNEGKVDHD